MAQNTEPTPFEERWSMVSFAMGAPTVYDIPVAFASRQALAQKLLVTQSGESISLRTIPLRLPNYWLSLARALSALSRLASGPIGPPRYRKRRTAARPVRAYLIVLPNPNDCLGYWLFSLFYEPTSEMSHQR
uniref:Uncharacterized protein n=1 Tax=Tanacetum cinerariifolium TaxID=118510 RepID=A0A699R5Y0_TANCI|nr:hypothetical protein [Tanacetum cinerariifolium]